MFKFRNATYLAVASCLSAVLVTVLAQDPSDPDVNQLGPTGALAFYDRICSHKGLDIIPCTQHLMQRDELGREWILRTIDFYTRRMVGDTDRDGDLDSTDQSNISTTIGSCDGYDCEGDVNNDLEVTQADLDILEANLKSGDAYNVFDFANCFATPCTTECGAVYDGCSVCMGSTSKTHPECPQTQPATCQCPLSECDDCARWSAASDPTKGRGALPYLPPPAMAAVDGPTRPGS